MKIKVETIYGNVNLRSYYDCDSSSDFYNAYDDNDHYLGELWDLPYYDENDKESMEFLNVAIDTAIECNDICTPFDTEKENDIIRWRIVSPPHLCLYSKPLYVIAWISTTLLGSMPIFQPGF